MTDEQAKAATMKEMADWKSTVLSKLNELRQSRAVVDLRFRDPADGVDKSYCMLTDLMGRIPDDACLRLYEDCAKMFGNARFE